jgi:hypothetical protein
MTEENEGGKPAEGGDEFKAITSQEQLDRLIGERINRVKSQFADYDDLKAKATKLADLEEANKSEVQKEREAREAAEKERDAIKAESLRLTVAAEKGLTPGQAKRLVGATREDLEKDADALLAEFTPAKKKQQPAAGALSSGAAPEQRTGEKGRAAAALRALRQG